MPQVLVIDDDASVLQILERTLCCAGFEVLTAGSGQEGLTLARLIHIDVILLDLRLPDMSGIDVLREIRHEDLAIPIVILTAFGSIPSAVEATRLGAVAYLEKPVGASDILAAVRGAVTACSQALPTVSPAEPIGDSPSAGRWARTVLSCLNATSDPRNLKEWGSLAYAASSTIKLRCHGAGVSAKNSLDFARVLRALLLAQQAGSSINEFLDADPRTLLRLLSDAGLNHEAVVGGWIPTVEDYLDRQRLVTSTQALAAIRSHLQRRT